MSKQSEPARSKPKPSQAICAFDHKTKRRRITVTLTPAAAGIVAQDQTENGISKTRAIEELILQNR
jgi:hypothetical protein